MLIAVNTPTGSSILLDVEPTDTIMTFKQKVSEKLGFPPCMQRLLNSNKLLLDSTPLAGGRIESIDLFLTMGDLRGTHSFKTAHGQMFSASRNDIYVTKEQAKEECAKKLQQLMAKKGGDEVHLTNGRQLALYSCDGTITLADVLDPEAGCIQMQSEVKGICHCGGGMYSELRELCTCNYCGKFMGEIRDDSRSEAMIH